MIRCKLLILLVLCTLIIGCSADVNLSRGEIVVKQGETEIKNETGYFDFGNIPLGFSQSITFTIENKGVETLELTGNPAVQTFGTNATEFNAYTNLTKTSIASEESTTFRIHFKPESMGKKSARVSIENDCKGKNPYTFVVVGNCTSPAPEIHVKQDESDILSPTGKFDFGMISVGKSSAEVIFTIENNGNENLELTGNPDKISITGANADQFEVNQTTVQNPIVGNNSTYFKITFKPNTAGLKTAKINIVNNDSDENPYIFTITGIGEAIPEINVKQGTDDIVNVSGVYKIQDTLINESSAEVTFTIENLGDATLTLDDNPDYVKISGNDAAMFTANVSATDGIIFACDSTTFGITFKPTSTGMKSATISIANNDDDEDPYTFELQGVGVSSEINIKQGSDNIENSTGQYDFVGVRVNLTTPEIEFTIENNGDGDLKLNGSPIVEITGADASMFTLNTTSTSSIVTPGSSTSFKIKCTPTSLGLKTATVSIANNDSDENPYTFTIRGFGVVYTEGDVNGDGLADMVVGSNLNDSSGTNAGRVYIFFGKSNWNSSYDASNADVKISGEDVSDEFGYSISMAGDVNDDGFEDIVVGAHFDDDGGTKSGCVFIFFGRYNWKSGVDASEADVKLIGADADDQFGTAVTCGGDINNDGIKDVIVGAYYDDDGGTYSGCAFIFFGRTQWPSQIDASNANVKLIGENERDYFGCEISSAGDVNKDGINDIVVGAYENDEGASKAGAAYIFFGRSVWGSSIDASNANVKLIGEDADDWFGRKLSSGGDINNDGIDDLVIGAYTDDDGGDYSGCAFIFFGRSVWANKLDASIASIKIIGADTGDFFGVSMSSSEDINNDGTSDLIIGAQNDDDGGDRSGCLFIFFGRNSWNLSYVSSNANVKIVGEDPLNYLGYTCVSFGDVNNDGICDVFVGAFGDDDGGSYAGAAYFFFGRNSWSSIIDASNANVKIIGEDATDRLGSNLFGN